MYLVRRYAVYYVCVDVVSIENNSVHTVVFCRARLARDQDTALTKEKLWIKTRQIVPVYTMLVSGSI